MLSSSTPDLREGSTSSVSVTSLMGRSVLITPGTDKPSHAGTVKDVVPRPGSAPATKFSDCDSAFEEGVDMVDPTGDFGDIFSVLSIDDDPKHSEADQMTTRDTDDKPKNSESMIGDQNSGAEDRNQSQIFPSNLGVFRSIIPAIVEVSGEESDSYQSKPKANPPHRTVVDSSQSESQARKLSRDKTSLDFKPRQVKYLQTPQVCVSTSDDTSSDSNDEVSQLTLPAMRRNGGAFRRRHSLAATTPDQITRMLLSHRRGSSSGLPIPCANCFQKMNCESSSRCRKHVDKLKSIEGEKYSRPQNRSFSTTARPNNQHLFPHQAVQPHHGPSGRRASFSRPRSPIRVVTPQDAPPSSSMHLRPVSPEPLSTTASDNPQDITAPRAVSPRAVYPSSSGHLSPRSLSPRPLSPRPRSPGLMRQRSLSPRDEIEMILSCTPPTTPPRSRSPSISPRPFSSSSSSSVSLTVSSQERSRSPALNMMSIGHQSSTTVPPHQRARSRSPRPKDRHGGRLSRRPSLSTGDTGEPESARTESPNTSSSLRPNLGVPGKPSRTRSRSPVPRSLKPGPSHSRPSSPQPNRARSPRPTDHDRRSSRRGSPLADIAAKTAEFSSLGGGGLSRRPSRAPSPRVPDDSDDGITDPERIVMDRRRRRGSRAKILPMSDHQKLVFSARQSRRKSICISHPTQDGSSAPGPAERADILAKLSKRGRRRSSWAATGEPLIPMTPVSALTLLREGSSNAEEETEQTKDPYGLTLHFITDPGRSHPLRKILRPLIESIVPKHKLFNFVERSESAARDQRETAGGPDQDKPASVPTLGVVLLLQEEFGMERILEAQKYLGTEPWELHHRGKVGSNNVPYPTNNQDFYAHPSWPDAALWAVRQVHFGKDRLRFQLFVSNEMWADSISFYSLLLSRSTHVEKADFCYFLVFCSQTLNLEVQLALKKLPPGFKPQFLDSTILQFKVGDMGQLVPLLPRVCIPISDKRWQTADPDGNKVLLFRDGDSCGTTVTPTTPDPPDTPGNGRLATLTAPSCDTERQSHNIQDHGGHFEDWMQESNLVSAV
ncbi:serine/arginine repetitive matrix protein 2-like [Patiria miniata]|uniref:FAM124 domain-containing protein n=1 Tax=Patiria miniata TaxID=46514 RepID=A0A914B515_PATMI|nr:serine/arginine repetitive matrix protein 2-like [Patiria miniata]